MRPPIPNIPADDAVVEFQAYDKAWYAVRIVPSDDTLTLTVKYCNFTDEHDETYSVFGFKTLKVVEYFGAKFRPVSAQAQDSECRTGKVFESVKVCAAYVVSEDDVRFYDAYVDEVKYKEHSFAEGEEVCKCEFVLLWQDGPNAGNRTSSSIEHICLLQPCIQVDPRGATFLEICRVVNNISSDAGLVSEDIGSSSVRHQSRTKELKSNKQSESTRQETEGMTSTRGNKHIILIENVEKDLSESTLVEFIHKQTDILTEAFVLPSLPSETYTRGIIMVDCKEKLEKLSAFLDDDFIVSSRGRPWVISEKVSMPNTFGVSFETVMHNSQKNALDGNSGNSNELRVVSSGSEDYLTAMKLRDLVIDFLDRQLKMHSKLDLEMRKMMKSLTITV